ncbi:hypothetical protein OAQ99_07495, partial [Candidatus Kapabacteria bacterium]|nr:hypothetical protein [Candidatus Kapabacteria bacterium]
SENINADLENNLENGFLAVKLNFLNQENLSFENLINLDVLPLLGNKMKDQINTKIVDVLVNTSYQVEEDTLSFEISGKCQLEQRSVGIQNNVGLKLPSGEINTSKLIIDIDIATSDKTEVLLVEINTGKKISLLEGSLNPGAYTLTYNEPLSTGTYIIYLSSGIAERSTKFMQIK